LLVFWVELDRKAEQEQSKSWTRALDARTLSLVITLCGGLGLCTKI